MHWKLSRSDVAPCRLHALWTLDGMGKTTWPVIEAALADVDARVRNSAVRIAEVFLAGEGRAAVVTRLIALSATEPDSQVQTQIALTLGECQDTALDLAMAAMASRVPDHPYLAEAILSGVKGRELELLEHCLAIGSGKTLIPSLAAVWPANAILPVSHGSWHSRKRPVPRLAKRCSLASPPIRRTSHAGR